MLHHYAIVDDTGVVTNVVIIDDEAVGFDDERGKWEPHGHEEARALGWVHLGPADEPPTAWIGDTISPNDDGSARHAG